MSLSFGCCWAALVRPSPLNATLRTLFYIKGLMNDIQYAQYVGRHAQADSC